MKKFLYKDFCDGLLHIIILLLPLFLGSFNSELVSSYNVFYSIPISLIVLVLNVIYEAIKIYRDIAYKYNTRIRIELIYVMIISGLDIFVVIYELAKFSENLAQVSLQNNTQILSAVNSADYTLPTAIYIFLLVPFVFEMFWVCIVQDLNISLPRIKRKSKIDEEESKALEKPLDFDVTAGDIN